MTPRIIDVPQGSAEWFAARLGKVSASRIADVVARTKTGYGASRANYLAELVAERLTGTPAEKFSNAAMAWGAEQEPAARSMFELMHDVSVAQVGLVLHPTIDMACASPDGLVGEDGLVEIKCPNTATHIETLLSETVDGKYIKQMHWQMACTGRRYCWFASYDPRLPAEMQLFTRRIDRDDRMIAELELEAIAFLVEVDDTVAKLVAKFGMKDAAE